ncbi:hypothetical protein EVAR_53761_1 [Eumeta japonica]|uniref:Uncharacterized protein n=1 Tax=Eumeta variegata TaxID=151549 RepID=A0A4C1Z541_EUMVA|nr:hypothetical protein EVAR_53761_1 [Eumeta japonica]
MKVSVAHSFFDTLTLPPSPHPSVYQISNSYPRAMTQEHLRSYKVRLDKATVHPLPEVREEGKQFSFLNRTTPALLP